MKEKQTVKWLWRNPNGVLVGGKMWDSELRARADMKGYLGDPVKFVDAKDKRTMRKAGMQVLSDFLKTLAN